MENLNIMMMAQVLFTQSHLTGQLENVTRAMKYFFSCSPKPTGEATSYACKVSLQS